MRQRLRRHPGVGSRRDSSWALLAAAAVFLLGTYLGGPFDEPSLSDYRRMGQFRAYWEFGKSLLPVAMALLTFVAVMLFRQSQLLPTTRDGQGGPADNE